MVRLSLLAAATALAVLLTATVARVDAASRIGESRSGRGDGSGMDAVVYGVGVSTDPYADSHIDGIGVATGLQRGILRWDMVRRPGLGSFGIAWIAPGRIVAGRAGPPFRAPLLFSFLAGQLRRLGAAPLRPLEAFGDWSPDGRLVATEPIAHCPKGQPQLFPQCYRQSGLVYVARADGTGRRMVARGHLGGWTPDERLLLTDNRGEQYTALDLDSGRRTAIIRPAAVARAAHVHRAGVGRPVWSGDRRYVAAIAGVGWPKQRGIVGTIVVARADGRVIRLITSRYVISMIAWSPRHHQLAWTTSGFPNPHELFVLEHPTGTPRKLFGTSDRHFDWITWSPNGRELLLDDAKAGFDPARPGRRPPGRWRLLDTQTGGTVRIFARLGGAPIWCCPANNYATVNG